MENHADRPEIRDADISEIGSSTRFSNTIKRDLFYLAIAIDGDKGKEFIRLSVHLEDVEKAVDRIRMRIILGSLIALFIVILIGLLQTRRILLRILPLSHKMLLPAISGKDCLSRRKVNLENWARISVIWLRNSTAG